MMTPTMLRACATLALVAAFAKPLSAQAPALPGAVTLDQVLQLLATTSPRTTADRAAIAVAEAGRTTALNLPNPSISYGNTHLVSGLSTGAVTTHQTVVEQPLLIFKQRAARVNEADLNVKVEQAKAAAQLASRRLEVRQAFASLLARQEQLRVAEQGLADLERVAALVRGRARAGERSAYDVARIETETGTQTVEVMNARAEVDDAAGHLASVLGFPGWSPYAIGELTLGNVSTNTEELWRQASDRRPSLRSLRQQEAAARGSLFLAQRERLPVPAVSGGLQNTNDVAGTSTFVGVSVPLPLFDRGQGAIATANAQINLATLAVTAEEATVRAEIVRSANLLTKRRDALAFLEKSVVERSASLRQMAEAAYREGSSDILDLLDVLRKLKDVQVAHVLQLESTKLAEEALISAAALDESPTPQP